MISRGQRSYINQELPRSLTSVRFRANAYSPFFATRARNYCLVAKVWTWFERLNRYSPDSLVRAKLVCVCPAVRLVYFFCILGISKKIDLLFDLRGLYVVKAIQLQLFEECRNIKQRAEECWRETAIRSYRFKFVDLFSGIGGFRIPLGNLGGQCVGFSEIDREAIKVYRQNFSGKSDQDEIELGDITQIETLPSNLDLIVGGVPCQPWSVAGKLKGFDDPRGQLWFDTIRLIREAKPKAFIFENVRGLANPRNRVHLERIISDLQNKSYCVKWKVINSYDFGVPQSRDRVFIVGIRRDIARCDAYRFPDPVQDKPKLRDVIDDLKCIKIQDKVKIDPTILFGGGIPPSRNRFQKDDELNDFFVFSDLRNGHTTIHSWDIVQTSRKEKNICLTLLRNRRRKRYGIKDGNPLSLQDFREHLDLGDCDIQSLVAKNILRAINVDGEDKYDFVNSKNSSGINGIYRIFLPQSDMIPTLTATGSKDYIATETIHSDNPETYKRLFLDEIYNPGRFRAVTARDARSLQGFPEWFEIHEKDQTARKQFGNAVSVPVVFYIAKNLISILSEEC